MDTSDDTGSRIPRYHWIMGGILLVMTAIAFLSWGTLLTRAATDDGSRISRADAVHIAFSATTGFVWLTAAAMWVIIHFVHQQFDKLRTMLQQHLAAVRDAGYWQGSAQTLRDMTNDSGAADVIDLRDRVNGVGGVKPHA